MKTTLNPYLMFDGNAAEVLKFYQSAIGGELDIQTYGEAGMSDDPEIKNKIIHAELRCDMMSIMASDSHPEYSPPLQFGNNVYLSLVGNDKDKLTQYFNNLSEGGKIVMPLEKQFWGDLFGSFSDKFGINWMVNISQ